ncbi:hypothetical protein AVEN_82550-1, partial [Araneus ventricosus]
SAADKAGKNECWLFQVITAALLPSESVSRTTQTSDKHNSPWELSSKLRP